MTAVQIRRGSLAAWLAGGVVDAPCHGLCLRLTREGSCDPVPNRPVSWDGIALCGRFCRGFAARQPVTVVRRPRHRVTCRVPRRAATESLP
jgi:hypothetical protein